MTWTGIFAAGYDAALAVGAFATVFFSTALDLFAAMLG
jgi:hypothetical protein